MSYLLTEEQQLIKQNAREFAKEYLEPAALNWTKPASIPAEIVRQWRSTILGLSLPAEFGGTGVGHLSYVLAVEELAKVSAAVSSILVPPRLAGLLCHQQVGHGCSEKEISTCMAKGTMLGAFALAEPGPALGIGPDVVMATQTADGYILKGIKVVRRQRWCCRCVCRICLRRSSRRSQEPDRLPGGRQDTGTSDWSQQEKHGTARMPNCRRDSQQRALTEGSVAGNLNGARRLRRKRWRSASVAEAAETLGIAQAAVEHAAKYAKTTCPVRQANRHVPGDPDHAGRSGHQLPSLALRHL